MKTQIRSITDVAARQLCTGCGACSALYPESIEMVDTLDHCRRPRARVNVTVNGELLSALTVCPGAGLAHDESTIHPDSIQSLRDGWGPVLKLWEGAAGDEAIRWAGSSGGAATALAMFCLDRAQMAGVLHTAAREDAPHLNQTVMSSTREELLARTGSRYAPSSPAEGLREIMNASGPCVFIGKPCDVAAAQKMRRISPELEANLGLTIAFFCAGTPSTKGTLDLLSAVGVADPATVRSIRYRGNGWPGKWRIEFTDADGQPAHREMSYEDSWSFLEKYRQWRCYICPDHTGEFADIAVGDPWYREIRDGESGSSLILARTRRGEAIIKGAIESGYLVAEPTEPDLLPRSQPSLLKTRGALWGRLLALRLFGIPVPRFIALPAFRFWWTELTGWEKVQSIGGTAKRVMRRRLRQRVEVRPL